MIKWIVKIQVIVLISSMVLTSCKKEEDDPENNPSCPPPSFSLGNVGNGAFQMDQNGVGSYGFYELQYGANGFSLGNGTTETANSEHSVTGLTNGTYDVYLRGNCGGSEWSEWSGPQSILISDGVSSSCSNPDLLQGGSGNGGSVVMYWNGVDGVSYYEVEYGSTGFSMGNGTTVQVNGPDYQTTLANGIYDFYVRTNCGGSEWSAWAGPASFVVN